MATYPPRGQTSPAQNVQSIGAFAGRFGQSAPQDTTAQQALTRNPMFGRPIWTYVNIAAGPVRGPQPRLARGTGHTGDASLPGNAAILPGYLADQQYEPTTFTYDPVHKKSWQQALPKTINQGNDGREVVGTYEPHDFTPGTRFLSHTRSAANWQVMEYPPDFRNLLAWQQVQKYRLQSYTLQARPLTADNYFLGYQIDPQIAAQIGQSTLGNFGSAG